MNAERPAMNPAMLLNLNEHTDMDAQIQLSSSPMIEWGLPVAFGSASGSNRTSEHGDTDRPTSLPALLAAFVPSLITASLVIVAFLILRRPFKRVYMPRTYLDIIPEEDRTPISRRRRFSWLQILFNFKTSTQFNDHFILRHSTLDAYLYLRFLRTAILICLLGCCITWPILFPVNLTGGGTAKQLDRLSFGNIQDGSSRMYAHAAVAWVLFGLISILVARERLWLIGLRRAWILSRGRRGGVEDRTVLYLDPNRDQRQANPEAANGSQSDVQAEWGPDARKQWIVRETPELAELVQARDTGVLELETTQTSYIRRVDKQRSKLAKKVGSAMAHDRLHDRVQAMRPAHREFWISGEKADAINLLRNRVKEHAKQVNESRDELSGVSGSPDSSSNARTAAIFVEYATPAAAQRAFREANTIGNLPLPAHVPANFAMQSRLIGVNPKDVLWPNLSMGQATRLSKKSIANVLIAALIIFWSIPTAFIGTISNVGYLSNNFAWLGWIKNLPDPILGLLTGLLPPFLTSLLASYVPNFMRFIAKQSGAPTTVTAELQVQTWYYAFQLIQVFFVTALASSATAFVPKILQEPHRVPTLLAEKLPTSSNFYLTYFILQGLVSSSKNVLNITDLFFYVCRNTGPFNVGTPREKYSQHTSLKSMSWGKLYPKFTNFVVIALAYSCIAPLIMAPAAIGLMLFYIGYRYNLLFVVQPRAALEAQGRYYAHALQQLLAGVYVGELALIGLFGLRDATGPLIMAVILFLVTVAGCAGLNRWLAPLEQGLPGEFFLAGEDEAGGEGEEERPLLGAEEAEPDSRSQTQEEHDEEDSRIHRLGRELHVPNGILAHLSQFLDPHVYASQAAMKPYLAATSREPESQAPADADETEADQAERKKKDENYYANPAMTGPMPVVWLPRDEMGLSGWERAENEAAGIETTVVGAWLDDKSKVTIEQGKGGGRHGAFT